MDELENALATGFRVSGNQTNTSGHHPRFSLYKYNYRSLVQDQKSRQEEALERTKEKKFQNLSKLRNLSNHVEEEEEEEEETVCNKEWNNNRREYKKNILQKHKIKAMLSEWMLEKPESFEGDWMMVMTPVGKRCIVVASRGGRTEVYSKFGKFMFYFCSLLCTTKDHATINSVILDCIYSEQTESFYVLDILSFNNHHLWNSELEFRWYWMHSKFREELKGCDEYAPNNPHPFFPVHKSECTYEALQQAMSTGMDSYELDGLMFYHKKGNYEFNVSSLVLWLKAYMVQEVLGIEVHPIHLTNIPDDYRGFQGHSDKITDKKIEKMEAIKKKLSDTNKEKTDEHTNKEKADEHTNKEKADEHTNKANGFKTYKKKKELENSMDTLPNIIETPCGMKQYGNDKVINKNGEGYGENSGEDNENCDKNFENVDDDINGDETAMA